MLWAQLLLKLMVLAITYLERKQLLDAGKAEAIVQTLSETAARVKIAKENRTNIDDVPDNILLPKHLRFPETMGHPDPNPDSSINIHG